jgi:hypothetical protein
MKGLENFFKWIDGLTVSVNIFQSRVYNKIVQIRGENVVTGAMTGSCLKKRGTESV